MPIVTLITDLGKDTHVVAKAKAQLINALPQVHIIDIAHTVTPFLIDEAVYFARSVINDFPEGTVHLIAVDSDISKYKRVLACKYKGQFYITVDNGFLALLTKGEDCEVYNLNYNNLSVSSVSPMKTLLVPLAIKLIDKGVEAIGERVNDILEKTIEQPMVFSDALRGKVIYINNFNNAITNITKSLFDNERGGRRFRIVIGRFDSISSLSNSYSDVKVGDNLCFFNAEDLLEIAINRGNASQLLGLGKDKRVTVEFFDERAVSNEEQGFFKYDNQNSKNDF